VTARGRLGERTSLTLGVDSRRLNDGQDVFGRSADPLAEAQYPILGDASQLQTRTASHNWVSARLERGFDWAAFGDLSTTDFASGLSLAQYRRAVTGLAAHVTAGAVTLSGFGSLTSQSLRQLQIRGAGISGPYQLAADLLPGTEYLRVETRDLQNPERAVTTQGLRRFVDYELDYTRGVGLFKRPLPEADASGQPVHSLAHFEAGPLSIGAGYIQIGREFTNPPNAALQPGLIEENLKGGLKVGRTELRAEHSRQDFELLGIGRQHTRVGIVETIGSPFQVDAGVANDQVSGSSTTSSEVTAGELRTKWGATPKLQFWTEARRHFSLSGPDIAPDVW